ncbi:YbaN family protein [Pontiella sp.]|uniref:YbaN family protein n=1 Tax=Pontiella sp. TaxID=2837462 RepID=UPI00356B35EE
MARKNNVFYLIAGCALVALATLGIILPLLPTTPLLLLAAWCFANSSEKCHRWLLEHRLFGPIIRNWQENRCIPRRAKITSVLMILLFGGYAIYRLENPYVRIIGGALCLIGLITVLRIPVCPKD